MKQKTLPCTCCFIKVLYATTFPRYIYLHLAWLGPLVQAPRLLLHQLQCLEPVFVAAVVWAQRAMRRFRTTQALTFYSTT